MSVRRKDNSGDDPTFDTWINIDPSNGMIDSSSGPHSNSVDVDGEGKGWLSSLWNKWTGAGTTGQQDALNDYSSKEAQLNRDWQSDEAAKNRRFQAEQAQLDYDRQVEFYEQYQSIGAQMRQYKEAGLNPSLLAGGVSPSSSAPSASMPSGAMPSGSAASATSPMSSPAGLAGFMGQILNMLKLRSEIDVNKSVRDKNIADADLTSKNASWVDSLNNVRISEVQQRIEESKTKVNDLLSTIQLRDIQGQHYKKEIEIGNQRIALMGSQIELNESEKIIKDLDAEKMRLLMPYVQASAEAELMLSRAKNETEMCKAQNELSSANLKMMEYLVQENLLDKGYYDEQIKKAEWETKAVKRSYKWKPVNDVCSNVSKICVAASSLIGAISGVSSAGSAASAASFAAATAEVPPYFWN